MIYICVVYYSFTIFLKTNENQSFLKRRNIFVEMMVVYKLSAPSINCVNKNTDGLSTQRIERKRYGVRQREAPTRIQNKRSSNVNRNCFSHGLNQFSQINCKIRLEQVEHVKITVIHSAHATQSTTLPMDSVE